MTPVWSEGGSQLPLCLAAPARSLGHGDTAPPPPRPPHSCGVVTADPLDHCWGHVRGAAASHPAPNPGPCLTIAPASHWSPLKSHWAQSHCLTSTGRARLRAACVRRPVRAPTMARADPASLIKKVMMSYESSHETRKWKFMSHLHTSTLIQIFRKLFQKMKNHPLSQVCGCRTQLPAYITCELVNTQFFY